MPDYHQIIDQIRGAVQSSDQTRNERLETLAAGYAEACAEVNQRLGRCQWLLQQGLRSEAIQLAEAQPRLLDAVSMLDFPERAEWDEVVGIYAMASAPRILVEAARFLNEAYAEEEPLLDLLTTHRRLSMQRSPLRSRIGVMRKLVAQDSNNMIWVDDLRIYEKARFRQIQAEAAEAVRLNDGTHTGRLLAELRDQTWVEPPPKALVQGLTKADAQLRGQQTRAALADLEVRLNDAFAARDPIRGRIARQEWIAQIATSPLEPDDPIWNEVGPAMRWLESEDRRVEADRDYEAALNALVEALDDPRFIPLADLEDLGHKVLGHGQGMPEGLQIRYVSRLKAAETAQTRRFRLIAIASAASLILAGSLVFYLVRSNVRAGEADQAATALTDMLELARLEQATEFLEKLEKADPGLLSYPLLIEARQRYQAAHEKEVDRTLQFDKVMREAERAPLSRTEPMGLEIARTLARRETEKQAIASLIQRRQAALQAEHDKQAILLRPRLDTISRELHQIGQRLDSGPLDKIQVIDMISNSQRALSDLASDVALADEELQSLARNLGQSLESARNRFEKIQRQSGHLEEITAVVAYSSTGQPASFDRFASRIQDYIEAHPEDDRSKAFKETLNERPAWKAVEAWNRLVVEWKEVRDGPTPQVAKLQADLCARFLAQYPGFPAADDLAIYRKYAEAITRRAPAADGLVSKLQRLLSDILVDHIWMISVTDKDTNGRLVKSNYYATNAPVEQGPLLRFDSIIAFNGKNLTRAIAKDRITYCDLSPQSRIASEFKPIFADPSKLARWETVMTNLIQRILAEPDIDPILQVALLKKVVELATAGSEPLRREMEAFKSQLELNPLDINVTWMNPEASRLDRTRIEADRLVHALRTRIPDVKRVTAALAQIERSVRKTYRTVGWQTKDGGDWRVRTGATVPDQGELWVIIPAANPLMELRKMGSIGAGKPSIDARDLSTMAEGRPVFFVMKSL
jgi:hypothetical protein